MLWFLWVGPEEPSGTTFWKHATEEQIDDILRHAISVLGQPTTAHSQE